MKPNFFLLSLSVILFVSLQQGSATSFSLFDPQKKLICPKAPTGAVSECVLYPVRQGSECKIKLLTNGEASLEARLALLNLPVRYLGERTIQIQALIFTGDESGWYIAEKLVKLQREDSELRVQVIVDAVANLNPKTQALYFYMAANGIQLIGDFTDWKKDIKENSTMTAVNNRFHEKIWAIDNGKGEKFAIVGGMNTANEYFRVENEPHRKWRDQDLLAGGKIVDDIKNSFEKNMSYFSKFSFPLKSDYVFSIQGKKYKANEILKSHYHQLLRKEVVANVKHLDGHPLPIASLQESTCRWIQSRPRFGETFISQAYQSLMKEADQEILIANAYFVLTKDLRVYLELLKDAARRGVTVKILTNSDQTNDLKQLATLSRAYYKELLDVNFEPNIKGKIEIYEWRGQLIGKPPTDGTLHAKYAVFLKKTGEKAMIVGSFNLDPRSQDLNSESILAAENEGTTSNLKKIFYDDLTKSQQIHHEQAKKWDRPDKFTDQFQLQVIRFAERFF